MSAIHPPNLRGRRFYLPAAVLFLLFVIFHTTESPRVVTVASHLPSWKSRTKSSSSLGTANAIIPDPRCADLPGARDALLVMKTGANVIDDRLPVHFKTTFRCTPDFLIFSDKEQEFQGIKIHDALDELHKYVNMSRPDLAYYGYLKSSQGRDRQGWWSSWSHWEQKAPDEQSGAAWEMDKYKNIPILRKSYAMYPGKKWFIFIDADTTVMWANIMTWLGQLNSSSIYYIGSQNWIEDVEFAHGGSGYIVSQAAARIIAEENELQLREHLNFATNECCGDMVLAHAFHDHNVALNGSWPNIQGSRPDTMDYDSVKWCHAAMTFHHTTSEMTEQLYELERRFSEHKNVTYADVYHQLIQPQMSSSASAWDNLSEDIMFPSRDPDWQPSTQELEYMSSFEGCRAACKERQICFQWVYESNNSTNASLSGGSAEQWPGRCALRRAFSLGKKSSEGGRVRSGWDLGRIDHWIIRHPCPQAVFLTEWDANGNLEPSRRVQAASDKMAQEAEDEEQKELQSTIEEERAGEAKTGEGQNRDERT